MSAPISPECCDSCGESGHMLADPTMHYFDRLTLCGECYREYLEAEMPKELDAHLERLAERSYER